MNVWREIRNEMHIREIKQEKRRIVLNGWRTVGQERSAGEGKRVSFLKAKMRGRRNTYGFSVYWIR